MVAQTKPNVSDWKTAGLSPSTDPTNTHMMSVFKNADSDGSDDLDDEEDRTDFREVIDFFRDQVNSDGPESPIEPPLTGRQLEKSEVTSADDNVTR